ncbi:flippase-like domain-containing protein, partial [Candidatus Saccharibacteria bacterium]|nr:flippase-like domain-containing protein [Candidatus Saccharibacteria bacterium]
GAEPARREIWRTAWRVVMLGQYYDNVTPAAIGGQPFQIYYMRKHSGLPRGYTSSIPFVGMIAGQIAFIVLAVVCFFFSDVARENPALIVTAWLGLLFYAFWPVMVAGVSYFPGATAKFLNFFVKILARLKIVKDREKALARIEKEISEYADAIKMIMKTKGLFKKVLVLAFLFIFLTSIIPYFVLLAFGGDLDFWACLSTIMAVTSAVYFVPTPGNSVAAEGTFFVVFSSLSTGYIFWAMLVWRFFSYYIYIIIGALIYLKIKIENKN